MVRGSLEVCDRCPFCGSKEITCRKLKGEKLETFSLLGAFFKKFLSPKRYWCKCLSCGEEWECLKGPSVIS